MGKPLKGIMTDKTTETETQTEDVSGLKANNADLKSRLKKEQDKSRDLETRLDALEQSINDAADSTKTEIDREKARAARDIQRLTDANANLTSQLATLKIDNVINEQIAKAGVLPHHAPILATFLRNGATMENGEAVVGGKPLTDHLTEFFSSEAAKHYVAAPANSGAGATGSTTSAAGHGFTRENIKSRESEFLLIEKTDPELFKKIAADTGRSDLL